MPMPQVKISFIVPAYNEAARIGPVLEHATRWADEVVIMDKGSTDETLEICRNAGEKVFIRTIPFSERGHEKLSEIPGLVRNDWVFLGTCSEIPTKKLIEACRQILDQRESELDLVYVPRRMYAFGLHCSNPGWGVCHYPFLFHRRRARITDDVHDNFHAPDPTRTTRIPYAEDCCVHHMTYPTARSFWLASMQYFEAEIKKDLPPDKSIRQSFKNIERISQKVLQDGENWIPFYCAFVSYELGKALHVWEKARGRDEALLLYKNLTDHVLASEWTHTSDPSAALPPAPRGVPVAGLKPLAATLARLPYLLIKGTMLLRKLRPGRRSK
jgi:glycosyltransferase involved in cell wall biosynthesis